MELIVKRQVIKYLSMSLTQCINAIELQEIVSAGLILFFVIDILGAIPIVLKLRSETGVDPVRTTGIATAILLCFFFVGQRVLSIFDIELEDFVITGAIVFLIIGLEMILNRQIFKIDTESMQYASIVPLAFPIIAGPGTFAVLLTLQAKYALSNIAIAVMANMAVVYIVLHNVTLVERLLGKIGIYMVHKMMGLILLSMSIKLLKRHFC